MKVKVLNQMAVLALGLDGNADTITVDDAMGKALIAQLYAEPVATKKVERATKAPDDEPKSAPRSTKK